MKPIEDLEDLDLQENKMQPDKHLVTVDALIIEIGCIVLIKRRNEPYKNMWALPGGFVDKNEDTEDACIREAKEETGLDITIEKISGVYARPDRDPRGHTISIAYICKRNFGNNNIEASDDAIDVDWWELNELPELAFDHKKIIEDYILK